LHVQLTALIAVVKISALIAIKGISVLTMENAFNALLTVMDALVKPSASDAVIHITYNKINANPALTHSKVALNLNALVHA